MLRLIFSRLLQLPLILFVILVITFIMAWVMPGDPFTADAAKQPPVAVQRQAPLPLPTTTEPSAETEVASPLPRLV